MFLEHLPGIGRQHWKASRRMLLVAVTSFCCQLLLPVSDAIHSEAKASRQRWVTPKRDGSDKTRTELVHKLNIGM